MRVKKANLEYWVFMIDFNNKTPYKFNIFNDRIKERIAKRIRTKREDEKIRTLGQLKEFLKREFMYNYWSKSEYEYLVSSVFYKDESQQHKLDVYYQIESNLDMITRYVNDEMQLSLKQG